MIMIMKTKKHIDCQYVFQSMTMTMVCRKLNYRKFSFAFDNKDLLGMFTTFVRVAYEVGLYEKLSFNEIGDRLSKLLEESTGLSKGFGSGW